MQSAASRPSQISKSTTTALATDSWLPRQAYSRRQIGQSITPAAQVAIKDQSGNTVTTSTAPVTIVIGSNPAAGTLSGTTTLNAVGGVATFSNLKIDNYGLGYGLVASSPSVLAT